MPYYAYEVPNQGYIYIYPAATPAQASRYAQSVGGVLISGAVYPSYQAAQRAYPGQAKLVKPGAKPQPKKKAKGTQGKRAGPSGAEVVAAARSWLGVPYLYGGTTRQGVDCSGLVMNVAQEVGIKGCPRTSEAQWTWSQHITQSEAGAGDLVFFVGAEIDPPPGHVGIIVTPGKMIDAPTAGTVVRYDNYSDGPGINRIIGYGRLRGATYSKTANLSLQNQQGQGRRNQAAAAGTAGGTAMLIGGFALVITAILVLVIVGLHFRR